MKQWYHFEKNKTNFNGDPTVLPQKKLKFAKQSKLFKYVARITKLISVYFVEFNIYLNYIQLYLYSIQLSHNFIKFSFSNFGLKKKHFIRHFQSKIRELEKKLELQNVHHEELLLEMAAIKRSSQQRTSLPGIYNTSSWKKPAASNQEVQTSPESNASGTRNQILSCTLTNKNTVAQCKNPLM